MEAAQNAHKVWVRQAGRTAGSAASTPLDWPSLSAPLRTFSCKLGGGEGDGGGQPSCPVPHPHQVVNNVPFQLPAGEGDGGGQPSCSVPRHPAGHGAGRWAGAGLGRQCAGQQTPCPHACGTGHAAMFSACICFVGCTSPQRPLLHRACPAAAAGHPEEAFPLLEKGLGVAVDNYNHHVRPKLCHASGPLCRL